MKQIATGLMPTLNNGDVAVGNDDSIARQGIIGYDLRSARLDRTEKTEAKTADPPEGREGRTTLLLKKTAHNLVELGFR